MNYLYLIKQLFKYETYLKYRQHIKVEKDQKEVFFLFKALDQLMEKFHKDISYDDYALWVQVNLGNDYGIFLSLIKEANSDNAVLEDTLQTIKERALSYELAQLALSVSEGRAEVSDILEFAKKFEQLEKTEQDNPFITSSLEELYDESFKYPGLRWRLSSLNRSLGSLREGDFGFIFARPETGKTTFLASEVSHFASQSDRNIIWFNNEEQHKKVMLRIIQAALGLDIQTLAKNLRDYEEQYKQLTQDKIKLPSLDIIHRKDVEAICKEYNPSCVVIDQLSKIKGFTNDREDLRLGALFNWAREIAKEYKCVVIGVNQADASAEGKKYLNMDNVANSKTAIQAEADFMLGIGKSNEGGFEYIRHLNICKNKLMGDQDSDPMMRHGKIDVLIQPEIARYKDF